MYASANVNVQSMENYCSGKKREGREREEIFSDLLPLSLSLFVTSEKKREQCVYVHT
jgi:hypothetical protein